MYWEPLLWRLADAKPEVKYFLIAYLREFLTAKYVQLSVKELSLKLGVTTHVVTNATNYLVESGLLIRYRAPSTGGRPTWRYLLADELIARLRQDQLCGETTYHEKLIDQLFCTDGQLDSCRQLKVASKLLLAILLISSDRVGRVTSLKRSELELLTGMKSDCLKYQLKKLLKIGVIRSYVPGTAYGKFMGRCTSIYFLNLRAMSLNESSGGVIVFQDDLNARSITDSFFRAIKKFNQIKGNLSKQANRDGDEKIVLNRCAKRFQIKPEDFEAIAQECSGTLGLFKRNYAAQLNEFASYLLSNDWDALNKQDLDIHDRAHLKGEAASFFETDTLTPIQEVMAQQGFKIALVTLSGQKELIAGGLSEYFHVILPDITFFGGITVELHPKESAPRVDKWHFRGCDGKSELDLPLSQRILWGMLTEPKAKKLS